MAPGIGRFDSDLTIKSKPPLFEAEGGISGDVITDRFH